MTARVISIADHSPLRNALQRSVDHADEVDLAGALLETAGYLNGTGENIRQLALLNDEPTIFVLANALADCQFAMNAICAYAVSRGIRLASSAAPIGERAP